MQILTTVTQKGQITLPKKFRDSLEIKSYGKVIVEATTNYLKVYPAEDILDLAGSLIPKKRKQSLKARQKIEKNYHRI